MKNKFKSKYKIPIYSGYLILIFVTDNENEEFKKYYGINEFDDYDAVAADYPNEYKHYYIFFNLKNKITPGIIAHECKHVLNYVFKDNNLKLDVDNDEAECYFLTWLVNKVHQSVCKFNIKIQ